MIPELTPPVIWRGDGRCRTFALHSGQGGSTTEESVRIEERSDAIPALTTEPVASRTPQHRSLLRVLGGLFGLAMVVGATLGGGILRTPGEIAAALPVPALFMAVWVFGGIVTLLGANVWAELGAMMPRAGGPYMYARRAFGDGVGLFVGYADWINWCIGPVVLVLIVGEYMGGLFPALAPHALLVDFVTLGVLATLQWIGVRSGGRTQEVTTALKAIAIVALVVAAFVLPHEAASALPVVAPRGTELLFAFGVAMQGVVFTYDAYYSVVYCSEDMRDPGRDIPRSIFRGVWLIIAIYLVVNLAYLAVIPASRMAGDPFVAATMARSIFGAAGDTIIRVIMILSLLGAINAQLMIMPRVLLAMSRDGLFSRHAARINSGGTPTVALALSLLVVVAFLLTGSFTVVLAFDSILIVALYVITFLTLFALRRREPDTPRPYRARGYPFVPALALLVALALLAAMSLSDPRSALIVLAILLASWPLSRLTSRLIRGS
jgi:APA family basic amino acid/polyamine antiporter